MKTLGAIFLGILLLGAGGCENKEAQAKQQEQKKYPPVNLDASLKQAKQENKLVLLEFTGSDWCPPCKHMHKNVIATPEFESYVKSNLVFVVADFPEFTPLPEAEKRKNEELAKKFNIEGFPTYVLLDASGKELWRQVGAFAQTPTQFFEPIEKASKTAGK